MEFATLVSTFLLLLTLVYLVCCVVIFFTAQDAIIVEKGTRNIFREKEDRVTREDVYSNKTLTRVSYTDLQPGFFNKYLLYHARLVDQAGGKIQSLQKYFASANVNTDTSFESAYRGQLGLLPSKDVRPSDSAFRQAGIYENSLAAIVAALEGQVDLCQSICTSLVTLVLYEGATLNNFYEPGWELPFSDIFDKERSTAYHGLRTRYHAIHGQPSTEPEYATETINSQNLESFSECGRKEAGVGFLAWRRSEMGYQAKDNAWVALALAFVSNFLGEEVLTKHACDLYLAASEFVLDFVLTKTKTEDVFVEGNGAGIRDDSESVVFVDRYEYDPLEKKVGNLVQSLGALSPHVFASGYCSHLDDFDTEEPTENSRDPRSFDFEHYERFSNNKDIFPDDTDAAIKSYYTEKLNGAEYVGKTKRKDLYGSSPDNQTNEYAATTKTVDHAVIMAAAQQLRVAISLRQDLPSQLSLPLSLSTKLQNAEETCSNVMKDMLNYSTPYVAKKFNAFLNYYSSSIVEVNKRKVTRVGVEYTKTFEKNKNYEFVGDPGPTFKDWFSTTLVKTYQKYLQGIGKEPWTGIVLEDLDEEATLDVPEGSYCVELRHDFEYYTSSFVEAGSMYGQAYYNVAPYLQYFKRVPNVEDQVDRVQVNYNNNMDTRAFGSNAPSQFYPILCGHLYADGALEETSKVDPSTDEYFVKNTDGRSIDDVVKWSLDNLAVKDSFDSPAGCGSRTHKNSALAYDPCDVFEADSAPSLNGIFFGFANAPTGAAISNAIDFECTATGVMALSKHLFYSLRPRTQDPTRADAPDRGDEVELVAEVTEKINSRIASMLRIASRSRRVYTVSQTKGVPGSTHSKDFYEGMVNPNLSGEGFSKFRFSDTAATCWTYLALQYSSVVQSHPEIAELFNPLSTEFVGCDAIQRTAAPLFKTSMETQQRRSNIVAKGLRALTTSINTGYKWTRRSAAKIGSALPNSSGAWYRDFAGIAHFFQNVYQKATSENLRKESFFTEMVPSSIKRPCPDYSCNQISFLKNKSSGRQMEQETFRDVSAVQAVAFYRSYLENMSRDLRTNINAGGGFGILRPEIFCRTEAFVNEPSFRIQSRIVRKFFDKFLKKQKITGVDNDGTITATETMCIAQPSEVHNLRETFDKNIKQHDGWSAQEDYGNHINYINLSNLFSSLGENSI